ncbi:hypothetical protein ODU07_05120 [Streptococcus suis]
MMIDFASVKKAILNDGLARPPIGRMYLGERLVWEYSREVVTFKNVVYTPDNRWLFTLKGGKIPRPVHYIEVGEQRYDIRLFTPIVSNLSDHSRLQFTSNSDFTQFMRRNGIDWYFSKETDRVRVIGG